MDEERDLWKVLIERTRSKERTNDRMNWSITLIEGPVHVVRMIKKVQFIIFHNVLLGDNKIVILDKLLASHCSRLLKEITTHGKDNSYFAFQAKKKTIDNKTINK